jgi:succinate dehydrogenase / fumarate reductase, membrane anchor subunit
MATRTGREYSEATRWRRRPRPTFAWTAQVVSGVLLLVLLTVHMVAQHFVVAGGLRTYADVIAWVRNPVVLVTDALLLICVTWHGIAGVHAVLLDLGLRGRAERIVALVLFDVGVITVLYGLWLLYMLAFRGG